MANIKVTLYNFLGFVPLEATSVIALLCKSLQYDDELCGK